MGTLSIDIPAKMLSYIDVRKEMSMSELLGHISRCFMNLRIFENFYRLLPPLLESRTFDLVHLYHLSLAVMSSLWEVLNSRHSLGNPPSA
jgi:hypothetical protein